MKKEQLQYSADGQLKTKLQLIAEAYKFADTIDDLQARRDYLRSVKKTFNYMDTKLIVGVIVGVVFIGALILVSVLFPSTIQQYFGFYKAILAVSCACVAAILPGFFKFNSKIIKATSALGVFAAILILVKPSNDTFSVRVILQCQSTLTLSTGKVLLFIGQEPREAYIGANNDALFENVPIKYLNTSARINTKNIEPYSQLNPDSLYKLSNASVLYVKLQMELNNIISGYITSKRKPLKNVEITIGDYKDTSDANGYYKIVMSKAGLKDEQVITFYKKPLAVVRRKVLLSKLENLDIVMDK
jgi:hypothetical protein